jgi:hypothetical protein
MTMANKLTRRVFLGTAAVSTLAAGLPIAATAAVVVDDAALFAMAGKWRAAMAVYEAAARLHSDAECAYFGAKDALPPLPDPYELDGETRAAVEALPIAALRDKTHPANVAWSAEIAARQALVDQRKAELDSIGAMLGVDAADRKAMAALLRADRIARRIIAMPARTSAGLLLKLRVNEQRAVEPDDLLDALTADLRAMNGEAGA